MCSAPLYQRWQYSHQQVHDDYKEHSLHLCPPTIHCILFIDRSAVPSRHGGRILAHEQRCLCHIVIKQFISDLHHHVYFYNIFWYIKHFLPYYTNLSIDLTRMFVKLEEIFNNPSSYLRLKGPCMAINPPLSWLVETKATQPSFSCQSILMFVMI